MTESTDLVVTSSPLALADDWSLDRIKKEFTPVKEWRYSIKRKGRDIEGLTADGIQDAARELAKQGEAIRCLDVRLEKDTDTEAYFIAHAGRYAISPDGKEILLDSTIRAKRVEKFEKKADGTGKYFNEDWFEHGVTKAARNAEEALMPEALKQWMLVQSAGLEKSTRTPPPIPRGTMTPTRIRNLNGEYEQTPVIGPDSPTKPPERAERSQARQAAMTPVRPDNDCEHEATVSDDGRTVCAKCRFLL